MNDKGVLLKGLRGVMRYYKCAQKRAEEIRDNPNIPKSRMGECWYFYAGEIDEFYRVKK